MRTNNININIYETSDGLYSAGVNFIRQTGAGKEKGLELRTRNYRGIMNALMVLGTQLLSIPDADPELTEALAEDPYSEYVLRIKSCQGNFVIANEDGERYGLQAVGSLDGKRMSWCSNFKQKSLVGGEEVPICDVDPLYREVDGLWFYADTIERHVYVDDKLNDGEAPGAVIHMLGRYLLLLHALSISSPNVNETTILVRKDSRMRRNDSVRKVEFDRPYAYLKKELLVIQGLLVLMVVMPASSEFYTLGTSMLAAAGGVILAISKFKGRW